MNLPFAKKIKPKKTKLEKAKEWYNKRRKKSISGSREHTKKQMNKLSKRLSDGTKFRKNVRARDNNTCQLCYKMYLPHQLELDHTILQVHHVLGRGQNQFNERYAICLCGDFTHMECHRRVHANQKKYRPILLQKLDEIYKDWRKSK